MHSERLRIAVAIDGQQAAPITAASLRRLPADLSFPPWSAWRLERLLGSKALPADAVVKVESDEGLSSVFRPAQQAALGRELMLLVDDSGSALVLPRPDATTIAILQSHSSAGAEDAEPRATPLFDQPKRLRIERLQPRPQPPARHASLSILLASR